jgi:hypothetical protein
MDNIDQDKAAEREIDQLIRDLNSLERYLRLAPSVGLSISQIRQRLSKLQSQVVMPIENDWHTHVPTDRVRR